MSYKIWVAVEATCPEGATSMARDAAYEYVASYVIVEVFDVGDVLGGSVLQYSTHQRQCAELLAAEEKWQNSKFVEEAKNLNTHWESDLLECKSLEEAYVLFASDPGNYSAVAKSMRRISKLLLGDFDPYLSSYLDGMEFTSKTHHVRFRALSAPEEQYFVQIECC